MKAKKNLIEASFFMKKLTFSSLFFLLLMPNVNSQWFMNQYGVTNMNELTEPQLNLALEQSIKTIKTGQVLTVIGAIGTIVGTVIYSKGLSEMINEDISNIDKGLNKVTTGALIMAGGGTFLGVGIPVWVIGANRRNVVKVHLAKFQGQSYIPSIGIKINF
jgi:hypothetical protein